MASNKPDDERLAGISAAAGDPQSLPDMTEGQDYAQGDDFDVKPLPVDCPVAALGFLQQKFFFLDFAGQMIALGSEFRKGELMALFGTRMGWLDSFWPQWKNVGQKGGEPQFEKDGFSQKHAQQGLIMAASRKGLFDPRNKSRGRGAHLGDDGELVLHCGDKVLVGGRKGVRGRKRDDAEFKPGLVGNFVYPTLPKLPTPDDVAAGTEVAKQLLAAFESWNWKRGKIAAHLLLCWIATALLGGALRVRPHGWITGPSGAGKTTLQAFLRQLMGDWGIFTEDATEAGVRQLLDQDTLAVMFDEIEAEADNQEVVLKIVRLARLAYSGASAVRGSSDHQAKQFVARSCFLFSSIHYHELPAQDRNRIAILHLNKFPPKTEQFIIPELAKKWGDQLRRRLLEQWARLPVTLQIYQSEMLRQGYSGREQDTYGTLLACGDLLLHDADPKADQDGDRVWKRVRALADIIDAARAEAEDSSERCIKHLASHRLPAAKSGEAQDTVAKWVQRHFVNLHNKLDAAEGSKAKLAAHGLRLVHLDADHEFTEDGKPSQGGLREAYLTHDTAATWLAIANKTHQGVAEIFAKSSWPDGVWTQPLALIDGSWQNKKSRFGPGPAHGCVLVPIEAVIDVEDARAEAEKGRGGGAV